MEAIKEVYVSNMVCPQCVHYIGELLDELAFQKATIALGHIYFDKPISVDQLSVLKSKLKAAGFELVTSKQKILVEQIKAVVIQSIHAKTRLKKTMSVHLEYVLGVKYSHLSKVFSQSESITLEQYIILLKIERAKEFISYGELNLLAIADKLHYSDLSHFSRQFKKVVGVSPSVYKKEMKYNRQNLDQLIQEGI